MSRGRAAKDITGVRSGMVTAIQKSDIIRRGSVLWKCRCDCGKVFYTEAYKTHGKKIQSCGCLRNAHQFKDLTGQRFGSLTAVCRLNEKKGKETSYLWLCRCDCGKEIKASVNALMRGNVTSCGCMKKKRLQEKARNITGEKYGSLTALYPTVKRSRGSVVWACRCDCGNMTEVSYTDLATGNKKSCGCPSKKQPGPPVYMRYIDGTCIEILESKKLRSDNTSGYTGVQFHSKSGKWIATITFKGKAYNLGKYTDIYDAVKAREDAEEKLFGGFLRWYYATFPDKYYEGKRNHSVYRLWNI